MTKSQSMQALNIIKHNAVQIIPEGELLKKVDSGKKLIIKLGMDPTAADLHLGHAVVLMKLRQLQDLGHTVIFLIGDFTARIGDPTGKSKTRPPLSEQEIVHNMKTYCQQAGRILDISKVIIRYNSEWLGSLSAADFVQLCSRVTLSRIVERDDFHNRMIQHQAIGFHELLYPIFQGYDSVALRSDIEIGGTDQTFNLLMGRFLQEQYQQEPQVILTMPLLEGLDGVHKMSKSLGNAVGIAEPAHEAFGKLMSISDKLMWRYYELLLDISGEKLTTLEDSVARGDVHPMEAKKEMAYSIIARFWSVDEALQARAHFEELFQNRNYNLAQLVSLPSDYPSDVWIVDLIKMVSGIESSSEIRRLISSGAIAIDEQVCQDVKVHITWRVGMIIKVGKHRFYKLQKSE